MQNTPHTKSKLRVGILFGGKSAEHEISVLSAKNIIAALDTDMFEPVLIGIDTQGGWRELTSPQELQHMTAVAGTADAGGSAEALAKLESGKQHIDVIFPVLHGPLGEDGTVQGFLELANLPYVGCGVLSSAIGMDKDVMKRLLRDAGIPITDFVSLSSTQRSQLNPQAIIQKLGLPLFVKPANMGSSVGVSKAANQQKLTQAVDNAFRYDRKILIEKAVVGSEVECAVLGNDNPKVSVPGRIVLQADFYDYQAKYQDEKGTSLEIPAKLPSDVGKRAQALALETFRVLGCEGMARVDMFVTVSGEVLVNEINTIPGFTQFSMYPQLWEASGISYPALITELIHLAIERFEQKEQLQTTYTE